MEPIYYRDAYQTSFSATIVDSFEENGRYAVILSQTAFYPTSGGQPHDTGHLNDTAVIDVTVRKVDNAIVHWVESPLPVGETVQGVIDWQRRFDHMQQHSGQHMLSQAFIQIAEAPTVSFHLSPNSVTIDLDTRHLPSHVVHNVEQTVNQIVWQNRPIDVRFVTIEEAQALQVRKLPPTSREKIRLVDITDFDLTACGGTHVAATGGVGIIKVLKVEKYKKLTRVTFACGERALQDYEVKNGITAVLSQKLTTGLDALIPNIEKMQEESKQLQKEKRHLQGELMGYQAQAIAAAGEAVGNYHRVIHLMTEGDVALLRALGQQLTQNEKMVALLALVGEEKSQLLFTCADDVSVDIPNLLKEVVAQLGDGSGGGKGSSAMGGTTVTDKKRLVEVFTAVSNQHLQP